MLYRLAFAIGVLAIYAFIGDSVNDVLKFFGSDLRIPWWISIPLALYIGWNELESIRLASHDPPDTKTPLLIIALTAKMACADQPMTDEQHKSLSELDGDESFSYLRSKFRRAMATTPHGAGMLVRKTYWHIGHRPHDIYTALGWIFGVTGMNQKRLHNNGIEILDKIMCKWNIGPRMMNKIFREKGMVPMFVER